MCPVVEKDIADRIFFDALIESGIVKWKASVMYDGVHVGGGSSYHKYKVMDKLTRG